MPKGEALQVYAATGATLAIHLSIHVLDKVVADLVPHYGKDCPVAVVYRASWPDQRVVRGSLKDIADKVKEVFTLPWWVYVLLVGVPVGLYYGGPIIKGISTRIGKKVSGE